MKAAICPKVYRNIIILIISFINFSFFDAKADVYSEGVELEKKVVADNYAVYDTGKSAFLNCPSNQTIEITSGCSTSATWIAPLSSNVLATVESSHDSGDIFEIGKTTVTYVEKNASGDTTDICTFIINVVPKASYALSSCPGNITYDPDINCDRRALWFEPTVPCDLQLASNYQPGDDFPIGTTTVNYTSFKDGVIYGSCSFTVTIEDNFPPVFDSCPTDLTVDANENCAAVATWTLPTASDNCGFEPTLTSDFDSGDTFPIGTTTVTYTATDEGGNTATCSFDVIVEDNTGPQFLNLPSELRVSADENCDATVSWPIVEVDDNCTADIDIVVNSDKSPGNLFTLGETVVTYSAVDLAGNETIASFNVIVEDNTKPSTSNCPSNISVFTNNDCQSVATWDAPSFTDNCDSSPEVTSSHSPGDTFSIGDTEVVYTATDQAGNVSTCSFFVNVEDNVAPVITSQPGNIIVSANDNCEAIVSWADITASDNCGSPVNISTNYNSGDVFMIGETTVEITATDAAANESTSSFVITVLDESAPIIETELQDVIVPAADNSCEAIVNWSPPTFTDNCDTDLEITSTHSPGDLFPLGSTVVSYTVSDLAGNSNIYSFNATVEDKQAPSLTCLSDIRVSANAQCRAVAIWASPEIADNCDGNITLESDFNSGDVFPLGSTVVTYTATDQAGNSSTCSFNVIVEDNSAPEIVSELNDLQVSTSEEQCQAIVTWNDIVAVDNCSDEVSLTSNFKSGDVFLLGESVVEITATDNAGNETISSFTVTVEDNTAPVVVSCPNDVKVVAKGNCESIGQWNVPEFADNCDADLTIVSSHSPNEKFSLGTTVVTYTATDAAGNSRSCSFNVIVEDASAPIFTTCIADIITTSDEQCGAVAEWTTPQVTDNCDTSITLDSDFASGDRFPLGSTTVTYTATDNAGNSTTCSFDVLVEDNNSPVLISCPDKLTLGTNANCKAIAEWEEPVFEDCSDFSISSNFQLGDELPLGISVIEYTATDANGETSFCSFEVEVIDQTAPVVEFCPQDLNIAASDNCEAIVEWDIPKAVDNCSSVNTSSNYESGDSFPIGLTTVEYDFIDENGNKSSCSFDINVTDQTDILVENCPEDVTLKAENSNGTATVIWDEPIASAACSEVMVNTTHESGSIFEVGSTTVTYTFTTNSNQSFSCSFEVVVEPIVLEIEFNKLITPNGDGDNDEWIIEGIEQFPDNQVIIVDRWGAEIFSATGYNNDEVVWRGENINGEIVPRGTYYYFISVRNEQDAINRKGFLEILR